MRGPCVSRQPVGPIGPFLQWSPSGKADGARGSSGSGKTSIQQLIARFYDPTSGQVTFDGEGMSLGPSLN